MNHSVCSEEKVDSIHKLTAKNHIAFFSKHSIHPNHLLINLRFFVQELDSPDPHRFEINRKDEL